MIFIVTDSGVLRNFDTQEAVDTYVSVWGNGFRRISESEWNSLCPEGDNNFDRNSTPDGV